MMSLLVCGGGGAAEVRNRQGCSAVTKRTRLHDP